MSALDNILDEMYNDIKSHRRNRDDIILMSIKNRLDKSLLAYKKEMQRRESLDAVKIDNLMPKAKRGKIRVD